MSQRIKKKHPPSVPPPLSLSLPTSCCGLGTAPAADCTAYDADWTAAAALAAVGEGAVCDG